MSYVRGNLLSGERIVYEGKIHWIVFVPGALLLLVGAVIFPLGRENGVGPVLALLCAVLAIFLLLRALVRKVTTEVAVTSKRVIVKFGLIRRITTELNHSKVESFNVEQSILGRILGFGTLVVHGTGGGKTPIPNIDNPLGFRREAMQTIDASQVPAR